MKTSLFQFFFRSFFWRAASCLCFGGDSKQMYAYEANLLTILFIRFRIVSCQKWVKIIRVVHIAISSSNNKSPLFLDKIWFDSARYCTAAERTGVEPVNDYVFFASSRYVEHSRQRWQKHKMKMLVVSSRLLAGGPKTADATQPTHTYDVRMTFRTRSDMKPHYIPSAVHRPNGTTCNYICVKVGHLKRSFSMNDGRYAYNSFVFIFMFFERNDHLMLCIQIV